MSLEVSYPTAAEDRTTSALHDKLDRLLAKAKPTKREFIQKRFRDLYPKLEAHLTSGKLLKEVLSAFNELAQAKVCARKFNEMLEQERARRDEAGNPICCFSCGQPLHSAHQSDAARPHANGARSESADLLPTYSE
ncbi:hypothetical protein [uncultured Aquimonas sp.]|uniref:hypothetical protein n=1 Tax=uncultured Aquimonas sp. TaxID=385483 RepID=UPI0026264531|nr:hypothetical protein [uncultured Aquimonas sp.]